MSPFHLANNKAGRPCVVDAFGCHDAYATPELAAAECARRNAVTVRLASKRAAREIAQSKLGQLAKRLRVGLRLMPEISDHSTWAVKPTGSAVCA